MVSLTADINSHADGATGAPLRPDRNMALELVRATEAASIRAVPFIGRGRKEAADGAAVDAMRAFLTTVSFDGTIVIGEGEKDHAPMLFNGERVGNGTGPKCDVAVDPIDGTSLTAAGRNNALSVIAVSDHGTMLDSHGVKYKQWPYEESIGIPLVLRYGARVPAGAVDDRLIGIVDYAPTLLGLLGVPVPGAMQGRNLAPGGDLAAGERPESLFLQEAVATDQGARQGVTPWRGVRTETHTYARRVDGPWLLFDNVADPYQQRNLAAAPDAAALRDRLEAELATWMTRIGDTLEPRAALLERYGLTAVWAEREAHLHRGQNMSGAPPPAQAGGGSFGRPVR